MMCEFRSPRFGATVAFLIAVATMSACRDEPLVSSPLSPSSQSIADSGTVKAETEPTARFAVAELAEVTISAKGPFVPGKPIAITTQIRGLRRLDEAVGTLHLSGGGEIHGSAELARETWSTSVVGGHTTSRTGEISFDRPGYYAVTFALFLKDRTGSDRKSVGDSTLLRSAHVQRWILVSDEGGRIDSVYDNRDLKGDPVVGSNGAVGEFKRPPFAGVSSLDLSNSIGSKSLLNTTMSASVTYLSQDTSPFVRVGIPNALIVGDCMYLTTKIGYISLVTDGAGNFSVSCPSNATSFKGEVKLESTAARVYLFASPPVGVPANTSFQISANSTDSIYVISDQAGKIFSNHQRFNTSASAFFGRSRGQIRYVFKSTSSTSFYSPSDDVITIYGNSVWGNYGDFVISHEYGHAFHYVAIDPWGSGYGCIGGDHEFNSVETSSCAYVEGFADFFAAAMLRFQPAALQFLSLTQLELNPWKTIGQGLFIEGAFAAVLWDLVDDAVSADALAGDDDSFSMTGTQIAEIIQRCRLYNPGAYLLTHADQFIYCAEGAVNNARSAAPSLYQGGWGWYGSPLSWDGGTPTLPYLVVFRPMWLYNLYGI